MIDTHQLAKAFAKSGFDQDQTDALVSAFGQKVDDLVTKEHLEAVIAKQTLSLNLRFTEIEKGVTDLRSAMKLQWWWIALYGTVISIVAPYVLKLITK